MKNFTQYKILICFGLMSILAFFISCEGSYYQDISDFIDQEDLSTEIVITGGITSEYKYQFITLTKPMGIVDPDLDSISGAKVKVRIGNTYFEYLEECNHPNYLNGRRGVYVSKDSLQGVPDYEHTLIVDYNGKVYTATDFMEKVEEFDLSMIDLPEMQGGGEIDSLGNLIAPILQLDMINFGKERTSLYNWYKSDMTSDYKETLETSVYDFSCVDQQGLLSQMYSELMGAFSVRRDSNIRVSRMSVSDQYHNYLISVLKETFWSNDIFTTIPANVSTNVSDGGVGFFYASDVYDIEFLGEELIQIIE